MLNVSPCALGVSLWLLALTSIFASTILGIFKTNGRHSDSLFLHYFCNVSTIVCNMLTVGMSQSHFSSTQVWVTWFCGSVITHTRMHRTYVHTLVSERVALSFTERKGKVSTLVYFCCQLCCRGLVCIPSTIHKALPSLLLREPCWLQRFQRRGIAHSTGTELFTNGILPVRERRLSQ